MDAVEGSKFFVHMMSVVSSGHYGSLAPSSVDISPPGLVSVGPCRPLQEYAATSRSDPFLSQ